MNYTEIKEKFPKAFEALKYWLRLCEPEIDEYDCLMMYDGEQFNDRDLYDFFDGMGVFVSVGYWPDGTQFTGYSLDIVIDDTRSCEEFFFPTRHEAEISAFTKSFEILEERL